MKWYLFILLFLLLLVCEFLTGQPIPAIRFQYLATWGEKGSQTGQFREPEGIAVDPAGFIYIADTGNQRIQKFDTMGRFLVEIGGFGWEREQFDGPVAVSARNGLDVFIADHHNQRIERYDKDLHFLASFSSSDDQPEYLQFGFPLDVDISAQGELFCLDGENHRVLKLDILGNPQRSFGDFDAGEGRLVDPQRFLVTNQGLIYISDAAESRIVVFDIHGNFLYTFGSGILKKPMGLALLSQELILIADAAAKSVLAFDISKNQFRSIQLLHPAGFQEPIDVACWKDRIYVLDRKRHVIDVFQRMPVKD